MPVAAAVRKKESHTKSTEQTKVGSIEKMLSSPFAPLAVTGLFLLILVTWTCVDSSLPVHDAAWHSTYSNSVKQWLSRPRGWSWQTLNAILCMQPNYPAAVWFFNGFCKLFVGDSIWAERMILALHLCILNASSWLLANAVWKDRMKATLTLIFLDCCPLILALQHVSFIDLPHTAFFAAYLCSLAYWWNDTTWKRTALTAVLFGLDCASKQIAVLYAVPVLAVLGVILLLKRQFKPILQLLAIGLTGAAFLLTWVIPNFTELTQYTHHRSNLGATRFGFVAGVMRNAQVSASLIVQSFSPLMAAVLAALLFVRKKDGIKQLWLPLAATTIGIVLLLTVAFWNIPESRYFGPVMITLSMLLACQMANAYRSDNKKGGALLLVTITLCLVQTGLLCFQKRPVVTHPVVIGLSPVFKYLGISDSMLVNELPYYPKGDPWKQEWMFRFIEEIEGRGRPVYLNVLANSPEFNQGTLACMARMRKPCVFPTTWRCSMPDVSDSFTCTDKELHFMQWVALKTGPQYCRWFDERSSNNYEEVVGKLQKTDGLFIEAARQPLPDGTELVLYQNKFWMFNKNALPAAGGAH